MSGRTVISAGHGLETLDHVTESTSSSSPPTNRSGKKEGESRVNEESFVLFARIDDERANGYSNSSIAFLTFL